jgi:hypothetical protein
MSNLFGNDYDGRKAIPIFEGVVMYFPKALAAVAEVSHAGNAQHNPGEPLHWSRDKSTDQYNTALRHMMDHRMGGGRLEPQQEGQSFNNGWIKEPRDKDGVRHLAKAAWRILAALQLAIEEEEMASRGTGSSVDLISTALGREIKPTDKITLGPAEPYVFNHQTGTVTHTTCMCGIVPFHYRDGDLIPCVIAGGRTHTVTLCV